MQHPTEDIWSGKTTASEDAPDAGNFTAEDVPLSGSDSDDSSGG
ncbi:hypothetical protein ACFYMO_31420 [Streptomyces sp. NPDC007025]